MTSVGYPWNDCKNCIPGGIITQQSGYPRSNFKKPKLEMIKVVSTISAGKWCLPFSKIFLLKQFLSQQYLFKLNSGSILKWAKNISFGFLLSCNKCKYDQTSITIEYKIKLKHWM